jgi:hypothetical protein
MRIEELWKALEADATSGKSGNGGWLLRLAKPAASYPLFVGLEIASRRRAILLRLPLGLVPERRAWPRCKGLEPVAVALSGTGHFGIALKESRFADVFTALAEDLVRRMVPGTNANIQARDFLSQLKRWQTFLAASLEGLSEEGQRGLWGELYFLREHLLPIIGTAAVQGWKGGKRAHQDFQFDRHAIEVKTTLAKKPQMVRITSERQLDTISWETMFLNVIALDVRDSGGETLPTLVSSLRGSVKGSAEQEVLEEALLSAGYLDAHETRYLEKGYTIRSEDLFRVRRGFPRIVERDLMDGVGDVNYGLVVGACAKFKTTISELEKTFGGHSRPAQQRNRRKHV